MKRTTRAALLLTVGALVLGSIAAPAAADVSVSADLNQDGDCTDQGENYAIDDPTNQTGWISTGCVVIVLF